MGSSIICLPYYKGVCYNAVQQELGEDAIIFKGWPELEATFDRDVPANQQEWDTMRTNLLATSASKISVEEVDAFLGTQVFFRWYCAMRIGMRIYRFGGVEKQITCLEFNIK
jgi:hypothetical protein